MGNYNDVVVYPLRSFNYSYNGPMYVKGKGIYLIDEQGKKYIDAISGLWNVSFGHSNKRINDAVNKQLNDMSYVNLYCNNTMIVKQYAQELIQLLNGDFSRVIYSCSGSESIECAIKIARKYYKLKQKDNKNKIAILDMSYHGTTYAAMSASGMDEEEAQKYAPIVGGFVRLKTPFYISDDMVEAIERDEILMNLKETIEKRDDLAAILIEPVIGSGGIIVLPDWYIEALQEIAQEKDILIIMDEVATGFGRTGNLFDYMSRKIQPDILCLSKGINNGVIPMGATVINKKIEELFCIKDEYIEHFSTQNGNPLACAAAYETIKFLKEEGLIEHIQEMGAYLKEQLSEHILPLDIVRGIRGKGLMYGIDLIDKRNEPLSIEMLFELVEQLRKRGLIVYCFVVDGITSGISLFPSYEINTKEIDRIVSILKRALCKY